jgi:lipoprotein-releasing system ATP-binding protein
MLILTATGIEKSYRPSGQAPTVVLRGASITVEEGEFLAIVGPSGAGKSTLLHVLASLDEADAGTVEYRFERTISSNDVKGADLARLRNHDIGMVFQFHHLLPEFTALENVMMPRLIAGTAWSTARKEALDLLDHVGVAERADHAPSELSGGEQQRVAIARALVNTPRILFADEPTGNLDTANAENIIRLLTDLQRSTSITCIVATHSMDLARAAHRIVRMQDGLCIDDGSQAP